MVPEPPLPKPASVPVEIPALGKLVIEAVPLRFDRETVLENFGHGDVVVGVAVDPANMRPYVFLARRK